MIPKIKQTLLRLAIENPGTKGRFKLAAGIVYKRRLVACGINSYRTHPVMLNGAYRAAQVHLHAEADALVRASKILTPDQLTKASLYVTRVKRDSSGGWQEALAKPCDGCMALMTEVYNIGDIQWTINSKGRNGSSV